MPRLSLLNAKIGLKRDPGTRIRLSDFERNEKRGRLVGSKRATSPRVEINESRKTCK